MKKNQFGIIVSDKMEQSAVVEVEVWKTHRILKKRYKRHEKYLVHNPENKFKAGDLVEISESKPISHRKRWTITRKASKEEKA